MGHRGQQVAPAHDIGDEAGQGLAGLGFQLVGFHQQPRRLEQRQRAGAAKGMDRLQCGVAQAAFGQIDHPLESQTVIGRDHQPQIRHGIADFRPLVKARTADDLIGNAGGDQPLFKFAGLEPGADQNGHARQFGPGPPVGLDLVHHQPGFLAAVPDGTDANGVAVALLGAGAQSLAQTARIVGDQGAGRRQNMGGGAVIAFQPHHGGAGEILLEAQDVAHFGPAPGIDALIVVADAADVAVLLRQQPQPQILGDVGVLIFIHQNIMKAALILVQDVRVAQEQGQGVQQQIAEVAGVQAQQALLIQLVQILHASGGELTRRLARQLVGAQPPVLPALNGPHGGVDRPFAPIDALFHHDLFQQAGLVVAVQNGEVAGQPYRFRVTTQDTHGNGVKGAQPNLLGHRADQAGDALAHFAGGAIGEGHRQTGPRLGLAVAQNMGQARSQHLGLAGSRAGQHQNRAVGDGHRLELLRVQPVQPWGRDHSRSSGNQGGIVIQIEGVAHGRDHRQKSSNCHADFAVALQSG